MGGQLTGSQQSCSSHLQRRLQWSSDSLEATAWVLIPPPPAIISPRLDKQVWGKGGIKIWLINRWENAWHLYSYLTFSWLADVTNNVEEPWKDVRR